LQLLWKKVEDAFENGPKEDMIKWSQVALHALFRNVEDQNAAKVQRYEVCLLDYNHSLTLARKVMQCYMDLSDFEGASRTWKSMSENEKQHPLSQYVHYCLALRKGDEVEGEDGMICSTEDELSINSTIRLDLTCCSAR
jgi:hypothetical protein